MDDHGIVSEAFTLLQQGHIAAAQARFQEYLAQRVKVGNADMVETAWAQCVAEKRRALAAQQAAAAQQAGEKGWRGRKRQG